MKFSIIVPVFGVARYLRPCLESVARQSYDDWESICIDDGSIDGSALILDEFAAKDSRFHIVHKKNKGVAIARNTALARVQGAYYLFLDGDDIWHPDLLRICKQALEEYPNADILHFGYQDINETLGVIPAILPEIKYHFSLISDDYDYGVAGFTAVDKAYRSSLFGKLRQRQYKVGEDLLYLTQVYLLAKNEVSINAKLYGYRIYNTSTMRRPPTPQQAIDAIFFKRDIVMAVNLSGRHMTERTAHWLSCAMTELFSYDYFYRVFPRNAVRNAWSDALKTILRNSDFSLLQKMRMKIVSLCPYWPIIILFCWIPCWLKRIIYHK